MQFNGQTAPGKSRRTTYDREGASSTTLREAERASVSRPRQGHLQQCWRPSLRPSEPLPFAQLGCSLNRDENVYPRRCPGVAPNASLCGTAIAIGEKLLTLNAPSPVAESSRCRRQWATDGLGRLVGVSLARSPYEPRVPGRLPDGLSGDS